MKRLQPAVGTLLLATALAAPLAAQTVTGTMQGTVTDTTDAAVPGVTVTIRNLETEATREVTTNERGFYNAPFLAIGPYRVSAALSGFGAVTRDRVAVRLNDTLTVDFRLDPSVREEVTVTAERPPINMVTSDVKQALTAEQILDRPTVQNLNNNNTSSPWRRPSPASRRTRRRGRTTPPRRPARRSTSTAPARAAPPSRSTASTTTTRRRTRTGRA